MDPGIIATAVAVAINALYAVRHGHNVFSVFVGGGVLLLFVSGLDSLPGSNVGTAIGGAFLFATVIYRGSDSLAFLSDLMGG